ncbi:dipeptidase [Clostridium thailandense]|uniref:Membrane dipeptidase n=1 Tax=Clostridium thailandense TaxID=2794346 RepID=A0A949TKN8_9CLOT|nr:membrane dipeptidase [Clostridium thailandense]MBV7274080.1 membrane dipeptidase [Clostridium thailandense]MCH5137696.1 membrane dipeptidase [Clostridiaceae bacterium UIB06]
MKVFDCHSDILIDIANRRAQGERNVLKNHHIQRLNKGGIGGTILALWIDTPFVNEPNKRMLDILGSACDEFREAKDCAAVAYNVDDIKNIQNSGRLSIILGMEGLSGLEGNINIISLLYTLGVRHAMLTWNEENEFATGIGSKNLDRGVTELGIKALKRFEELGILIDVSHGNEKTFWDIYKNTTKPFIASHSNAYRICPSVRNLKDEQIKAIAKRKGIIGINAWSEFVDTESPSAEKLAEHIDYITSLVGIDYVGLGFDFCEFMDLDKLFFDEKSVLTPGIEDASKVLSFLDILSKKGYKKEDIEKITYRNIMRVFEEVLK